MTSVAGPIFLDEGSGSHKTFKTLSSNFNSVVILLLSFNLWMEGQFQVNDPQ